VATAPPSPAVFRRRRLVALGVLLLIVVGVVVLVGGGGGDEPAAKKAAAKQAPPKLAELPRGGRRLFPDRRIVAYVDGLTDEQLGGSIRYRRVSTPEEFEQALAPALAHFFNHQTHHRGQAHAILTGLGAKGPELDLLECQIAERSAAVTH